MNRDFSNKTVIVTGGAKGIGRAISLAFSAIGADVLAADIDDEAGALLEREAEDLTGTVTFQNADVSSSSACQKLVHFAKDRFNKIDILCNNVGIQPPASYVPLHELAEELWDSILDVNLKSAFLMSKYSLPHMLNQGAGVIINTGSVQGIQTAKGVAAYSSSKGGLIMLTKQMALEYASENIRVLCVNPGTIETPMVKTGAEAHGLVFSDLRDALSEAHPLGRVGQPEDVARLVLFLTSDDASFMTGESINIDGGIMTKGAWL